MNGSNTIEPSLIILLNDAPPNFVASPSLELPPLQNSNILNASGRPLPLEPDARKPNRDPDPGSQLNSNHTTILPPIDEDESSQKNDERTPSNSNNITERPAGDFSRQSLSKILDEDSNILNPNKKRNLKDQSKDDFVQLPQPPKKQKTTKQVVPPIIIGLFQPPPQSTIFPPIASSSFHDSHGRNSLNTIPLNSESSKEKPDDKSEKTVKKACTGNDGIQKKKNVAIRKKWTDEETNNLLLGVHKHGVGCWADILSDSSFVFNGRSSSDLKDRWRTCCPNELRKNISSASDKKKQCLKMRSRSSLISETILKQDENKVSEPVGDSSSLNIKQKKRSHRKKLEDLFQLGIEGPIRQSNRRERRQFTEEEDRAIIEGYKTFGPAWSKIQKEPRFKLQSRQPTDLRDRFRNKFPDKFREDKGNKGSLVAKKIDTKSKNKDKTVCVSQSVISNRDFQVPTKDTSNTSTQLMIQSLPSRDGLRIQEIISSEPFNTLTDQPSIDSVDNLSFSQFSDWNQSTTAPFPNIGEMDISRLLLDESWSDLSQGREKQNSPEASSLLTANSESLHQFPSFFNISNDTDDLSEEPFG